MDHQSKTQAHPVDTVSGEESGLHYLIVKYLCDP